MASQRKNIPSLRWSKSTAWQGAEFAAIAFLISKRTTRDYLGQISFFATEVWEDLRHELSLLNAQPPAIRRNALVRGADLTGLIGKQFEVQGRRLADVEESKPCHWMNQALGAGAEDWRRGRDGLRCCIPCDGKLNCEA